MKRITKAVLFILTAGSMFLIAACGDDSGQPQQQCGDGVCEGTETLASCPQDCELCGNGVLDPVEACDGTDFDGATCDSFGHGGGTLFCNADCSINDVAACCDHTCPTEGETQCVGDAVQACEVVAGCRAWVDQADCSATSESCVVRGGVAACEASCTDDCPAVDDTQCVGTVIQNCTVDAIDGCLDWVDGTDCDDTSEFCEDVAGTATCVDQCIDECATASTQQCGTDVVQECQQGGDGCNDWVTVDDCVSNGEVCVDTTGTPLCCADLCPSAGETRCNGPSDGVEVCGVGAEGCLDWVAQSSCAAGTVCQFGGGVAQCVSSSGGEDCSDPYVLGLGANSVAWTATTLDYITTTPACVAVGTIDGPDVVMSYTATANGFLDILVTNKPASTRWVLLVSSATCGTLAPEEACISEWSLTEMGDTISVTAGTTYYFYMADTSSGTAPLSNPFDLSLTLTDCATEPPAAVLTSTPTHGATDMYMGEDVIVTFDQAMDTSQGIVTLTGSGSTNVSYDLAANPFEVSWSNGDQTMTVNAGVLFAPGETITVSWSGIGDLLCGNVTPPPAPWSFTVESVSPGTGDNCFDPIALTAGAQTYAWTASHTDYFFSTPCGSSYNVDGPDVVGEFIASVNGYVNIVMQKPASNRMFMTAYEAPCGDFSAEADCINDFTPTSLTMEFPVTMGQSYFVYFADTTSGTQPLPNPLDLTITEVDCTPAPPAVASNESPANGGVDVSVAAALSVDFDQAVRTNFGTVAVTGDMGSSYSFDLSTAPSEVVFSAGDQTMTITLPANFGLSETVTVSWTGMQDAQCGKTIASIPWTFTTQASVDPGEDCASPIALQTGDATYAWFASQQDYFTAVACGSSTLSGPDVVGVYSATVNGYLSVTLNKPASQRMFMVISDATCGDVSAPLDCISDFTPTQLNLTVPITSGNDYFVYFSDTASGTGPLPNPLDLQITEIDCATFGAQAVTLTPAHGATTQSLSPTFVADFDVPPATTDGTVIITGDLGTNRSYAVATAPEISVSNGGLTVTVDPGVAFPAGENLTITWTGVLDSLCGNVVPPPVWDVTIATPPCQPGVGGVVGSNQTLLSSGLTTSSEYYVAADDDPNGWVYMGGTSVLYRMPKAGGATENVYTAAGLSTTHVGYAMLINGLDIFTIDSTTTGTSGKLYRISSDGGATWVVEDFVTFPVAPADDIRGATVWNGRIYMLTQEGTSSVATEIWSVSANPAAVPDTAVLEGTFAGEVYCNSITADDFNFYIGCATGERVIRVAHADAPNYQPVLVTDAVNLISTGGSIHAVDTGSDGLADVLYVHGYEPTVWYICDPAGAPYVDTLATVGSVNYGMGYDKSANRLWLYDDGSKDFVALD